MWIFLLIVIVAAIAYGVYKYLKTSNKPKPLTREDYEKMPLKELGDLNVHIAHIIMIYRPIYDNLPAEHRQKYGVQTWEELIALNKMIGEIYTKRSK